MSPLHGELMNAGVDIVSTLERFDGNEELLVRCLKLFANDASANEAADALDAGNFSRLGTIAHAIKGTAVNVGLVDLSSQWSDVLVAVRENRLEDVDGLAREALASFRTTREAILAL